MIECFARSGTGIKQDQIGFGMCGRFQIIGRPDAECLNNRQLAAQPQSAEIERIFTAVQLDILHEAGLCTFGDMLIRRVDEYADHRNRRIKRLPDRGCLLQRDRAPESGGENHACEVGSDRIENFGILCSHQPADFDDRHVFAPFRYCSIAALSAARISVSPISTASAFASRAA